MKKDRSKIPSTAAWNAIHLAPLIARRKGKGGVVRLKSRKSLPCIHVGEKLTMNEIKAAGLKERRSWHRCELGMAKNELDIPGISCSCAGCGPKCEGYKSS